MEHFKPLRNYLRKFNLTSMLAAIWHLSTHLEFKTSLPPYLREAHPWGKHPMRLGFYLWELDTLSREALLHCDPERGALVSSWAMVRDALNKLKQAEERAYVPTDETVISEIARIAHRQFHWQRGISHDHITRMRKLYRHPAMDDVVRHVYGLSTEQVAMGGFASLATYLRHFATGPDWVRNAEKAIGFDPTGLLNNLTSDYATMREAAFNARSLDENWAYAFNPLWQFPLLAIGEGKTICPIPGLLVRRVTDGLYFDVIGHDPDVLSAHMGPAFQEYVGEVLAAASSGNYRIIPEERYGPKKAVKDTVDWIIEDQTASLFVEVKLLRMGRAAKEFLAPHEAVLREFRKMAKAVGQLYATIDEARRSMYPSWKPSDRPIYPILVTLDNWNLFAHTTYDILVDLVRDDLISRGLNPDLVVTNRYVICCVTEFEHAVQVIDTVGIDAVMRDLTTGDEIGWLMLDFLLSRFGGIVKRNQPLFPDERERLLPEGMRNDLRLQNASRA